MNSEEDEVVVSYLGSSKNVSPKHNLLPNLYSDPQDAQSVTSPKEEQLNFR